MAGAAVVRAQADVLGASRNHSSTLSDLQEQLQQALDQQAQLSEQQTALAQDMQPLLTWVNTMASHSTPGCDLDHWTAISALCNTDAGAPAAPLQSEDAPATTDAGCSCLDTWYYAGQSWHGCQITDDVAKGSHWTHPPWCVVSSGCTNAHPGPYGSWDYCTETTGWLATQDGESWKEFWDAHQGETFAGTTQKLDSWLMEPQALFSSRHGHSLATGPALDEMCKVPTCRYAVTRFKDACHSTRDTVMQELMGLVQQSTQCANVTSSSPPPPAPGSRTYQITLLMAQHNELPADAMVQVVATLLGCETSDIHNFRPTDKPDTFAFTLVTYTLYRSTVISSLAPIGDIDIVTQYGYDMTDGEQGDDGLDPSVPPSGQSPPPRETPGMSTFLIMCGFSAFGTLVAISFCGVVGKVRGFAQVDESFEMSGGAPLLKHQRYDQPLPPAAPATYAAQPPAPPPAWNGGGPGMAGGAGPLQSDYGWEETWSAGEPAMSWDSPSHSSGTDSTESDNDYDGAPGGGGGTPEYGGYAQHREPWASADGMLTAATHAPPPLAAAAQAVPTGALDESVEGGAAAKTISTTPDSGPPVAQHVDVVAELAASDPSQRVAMLEAQLAEAQRQLMYQAQRQTEIAAMQAMNDDKQVKVEVYYGGGGAGAGGGAAGPPVGLGYRRPAVTEEPAAMPWLGGEAASLPLHHPPPEPMQPPPQVPSMPVPAQVKAEPGSSTTPDGAPAAKPALIKSDDPARPYKCQHPGCTYAAAQKRYLSEHERVHSGSRPYKCTWPGCNYAASGSGHMSRHMRVHTGERPYECKEPGCNYRASQSGHLRTHMRKHTGERPFACPVEGCGYSASRSGHLTRHMKVHERGGSRRGRGRPSRKTLAEEAARREQEAAAQPDSAAADGGGAEGPPPPSSG